MGNRINEKRKRNRWRLAFQQNNRCYWCKCRMKHPKTGPGHIPERAVTIEHLDSAHWTYKKNIKVAACRKCNQRRGLLDNYLFKCFRVPIWLWTWAKTVLGEDYCEQIQQAAGVRVVE